MFARSLSRVSAVLLVLILGIVLGYFRIGPARLVGVAVEVVDDLRANAAAYFGSEPIQHLRPSRFDGGGVVVSAPGRVAPGVTFVTGLFGEILGARLYAADGTLLYEWPVNFFAIAGEEMAYPYDALIHGDVLFPNGDFAANLDGRGIVRVSACGDIVWRNHDTSHHSISVDDDGNLWTPVKSGPYHQPAVVARPFGFDAIARFDAQTGELLERIDLVDVLLASDMVGLALANSLKVNDMIHLNDVEVLSAAMADAFPMFEAGDVMLSSRNFNQVWLLDGVSHQVKWVSMGPMIGQHDPDFQPDGTITLFDNRPGGAIEAATQFKGHKGGSRILALRPDTGTHEVIYASDARNVFYTPYRGKHQVLENGNVLITETDAGRVFEVTPDGEVVWSLVNQWDDTRVAWVMKATRYPAGYGDFVRAGCPQ